MCKKRYFNVVAARGKFLNTWYTLWHLSLEQCIIFYNDDNSGGKNYSGPTQVKVLIVQRLVD